MNDDDYVSSVPYRLMPPRKTPQSELGEALAAVRDTGTVREALDAASGTNPVAAAVADEFAWPDTPTRERWLRRLASANWVLILAAVGVIVAILAWLLPR